MSIRYCLALGLAWFSLLTPALSQTAIWINKVPGPVENTAQQLTHKLQQQGFEVNRGYFKLWTVDACPYTFDRVGLCFGNNPAAPYVTFSVPPGRVSFWTGSAVFGGLPNLVTMMSFVSIHAKRS